METALGINRQTPHRLSWNWNTSTDPMSLVELQNRAIYYQDLAEQRAQQAVPPPVNPRRSDAGDQDTGNVRKKLLSAIEEALEILGEPDVDTGAGGAGSFTGGK